MLCSEARPTAVLLGNTRGARNLADHGEIAPRCPKLSQTDVHSLSKDCHALPCAVQVDQALEFDRQSIQTMETFVQHDLNRFWKSGPTPVDDLDRSDLLVKLLDYCGLTRKVKENNLRRKLERLDAALCALGVLAMERIEPCQRVSHDAFLHSESLKMAVSRCGDSRMAWKQASRGSSGCVASRYPDGRSPLALWVQNVMMDVPSPVDTEGFTKPRLMGYAYTSG